MEELDADFTTRSVFFFIGESFNCGFEIFSVDLAINIAKEKQLVIEILKEVDRFNVVFDNDFDAILVLEVLVHNLR